MDAISGGRKSDAKQLEKLPPALGAPALDKEPGAMSQMAPRSIANYIFIVALAALLGGGVLATYHMVMMAVGS